MEKADIDPSSIAIVPIAVPMLSGPGAITSVMVLVNLYPEIEQRLAVIVAIVAVGVVSWLVLLSARPALAHHRRPRPRRLHQNHVAAPRRHRHPVHHQRTEAGDHRNHEDHAVKTLFLVNARSRLESPPRCRLADREVRATGITRSSPADRKRISMT